MPETDYLDRIKSFENRRRVVQKMINKALSMSKASHAMMNSDKFNGTTDSLCCKIMVCNKLEVRW